ncbi:MAG TPA: hypothetical protein VG125_06620 [Pirellulales bacterium]|nr:hypothetical protein [Pirellulales bacterium]
MALLGDVIGADVSSWRLRVQRTLKAGDETDGGGSIEIPNKSTDGSRPASGELLLALGSTKGKSSARAFWTTVPLNEASFGYVARLPLAQASVPRRLKYGLPFLEHSDPLIADDAYLEFAHAPLDEIARLADRLPVDRLRDWLADETVPADRKGLYGLLLGLAASAQGRQEIADDFWRWITAPANDFRNGFDGVLGGYLWMGKGRALARLEKRYLDDPRAGVGDVRHLLTAMRVYHDYGRDIGRDELMRAYRKFLGIPAVATLAIADLSRWHDWQSLDHVASLFGRPAYDDPATERAVIGFLLACPLPEAAGHVSRLRKLVPDRVAEAERLEQATPSGK